MIDSDLAQVIKDIEALGGNDALRLADLLDLHQEELKRQGHAKLLAFANFRAGRLAEAHRFLNQVPREELDQDELRLAATIRFQSRQTRRLRLGLYLPSDKRLSRRLIDGTINLWRHGRLRTPASKTAAGPRDLRAISARMRHARTNDVGQLQALLHQHEADYLSGGHAKFLAFNHYHAGSLSKAAQHVANIDRSSLSKEEAEFVDNIVFEHRAFKALKRGDPPIVLPTASPPARSLRHDGSPRSLYIAASSRPYVLSGYTSRSEALVGAMRECDEVELVPVTRPGFPRDRSDAASNKDTKPLLFSQLETAAPYRGDLETYLDANLPALSQHAREREIDVIHGVSNYRNGVIGLALARATGRPFVYEVRGLWEETTASKLSGWRETERFAFERAFEIYLANEADGVLVINTQVAAELGLETKTNVALLPNCVSHEAIVERGERSERPWTALGYVGSILEYEGLDDLVQAVARVRERGHDVRLDIYGRGGDRQRLQNLIGDLKVKKVSLRGTVDPSQVPSLYRQFDLCAFPRKPHRVCQLVTPLKPLEAMANDVNVIVSDVGPMAPFSSEGGALSCEAGNVDSLVAAIEAFLVMTSEERAALRTRGRRLLEDRYIWKKQCAVIADVYRAALATAETSDRRHANGARR